jgi:hypothetical protein
MTTNKDEYERALDKIKAGDYSPESFDIGDTVICDICNEDFTDSLECGGMLFGSYGVCPRCTPRMLEDIKKYKEEHGILAVAQPFETFKAFSLRMRGGNNTITFGKLND